MIVRIAPADQRRPHEEALQTLEQLASCDDEGRVEFRFDVSLHRYAALSPAGFDCDMSGDLSLAAYNDLKLSEYILENDSFTTRETRRFSLTARGREIAASVTH